MFLRHIKRQERGPYSRSDSIAWRRVFKEDLARRGAAGVYLRGVRLREGFTQKQLAKKLGRGVSQHHISEMENGKRTISIDMAKKLASALHANYRMFL